MMSMKGTFILNSQKIHLKEPNFEKLAEFKEKYMGACDGHSTERIVDVIKEFVNER